MKKIFIIIFILLSINVYADNNSTSTSATTKEQKLLYLNLSLNLGLVAYGINNWGYDLLDTKPHAQSEGWFRKDTKHGGADKFGHAYTGYLASHMFGYAYENFGYTKDEAALNATISSIILTSTMEIGDSFSGFGLSYEDVVANLVGAAFGYYTYMYESLGSKIDFRFEFMPDKDMIADDFTTEYEKNKYLLVLKASGFSCFEDTYLKYLELYAGYTINGFHDEPYTKERDTFFGIGINLSEILDIKIFNYYQIPDSYLSTYNK